MSRLADIQHFINVSMKLHTPTALVQVLTDMTKEMGFDIFTMFHHVNLNSLDRSLDYLRRGELLAVSNCCLDWAEYYRDRNFVVCDPRVLTTRRTAIPFRCDEMHKYISVSAVHREIRDCQARADIGEGFIIPVHFPGEPSGSCTFSMRCGRELPASNLPMAQWVGSCAFQAGRSFVMHARGGSGRSQRPQLTERQLQCVVLLGRGYSEERIGKRLGITRETVKQHLKAARAAYGTKKSAHLIVELIRDGRIQLEEFFETRL
jgi:LuxR family quorum-sensing system transcriptional regulator CciR